MVMSADLATRPASETVSTDSPSSGGLRPFGLTRGVALAENEALLSLDGLSYDPVLQVNVDAHGRPVMDSPLTPQMATSTDTQYDMQWFTDKD